MSKSGYEEVQKNMFGNEEEMRAMADVFAALSSDCRIEILYLLSRIPSLPS